MEKISAKTESKTVRFFDIGHPDVLESIARGMKFKAENANQNEIITHEIVEGLILTYNPKATSIDTMTARIQAAAVTASPGHS